MKGEVVAYTLSRDFEDSFELVKMGKICESEYKYFDWYSKSIQLAVEKEQKGGFEMDLMGETRN